MNLFQLGLGLHLPGLAFHGQPRIPRIIAEGERQRAHAIAGHHCLDGLSGADDLLRRIVFGQVGVPERVVADFEPQGNQFFELPGLKLRPKSLCGSLAPGRTKKIPFSAKSGCCLCMLRSIPTAQSGSISGVPFLTR